jgi:hypothetical protein
MPDGQSARYVAPLCRKLNAAVLADEHQAIAAETSQSHRHGGRRHREPIREARGNYLLAFTLRFENRFEVIFFRYGNHEIQPILPLTPVNQKGIAAMPFGGHRFSVQAEAGEFRLLSGISEFDIGCTATLLFGFACAAPTLIP